MSFMYKGKFASLSARKIGKAVDNAMVQLKEFENIIQKTLPTHYKAMLLEYAAPIVFDELTDYCPTKSSPLDRKDGTHSLEVLYGVGEGENGLLTIFKCYEGRIPRETISIAEVPGGNQICMCLSGCRTNKIYLWDHENEREITGISENDFDNMYLLADSFENFINSLKKRSEEKPKDDLGIIESESWLDI